MARNYEKHYTVREIRKMKDICKSAENINEAWNNIKIVFGNDISIEGLARCCFVMEHSNTSVMEYFSNYCRFKYVCGIRLQDFGYFGDIVETAIRLYSIPENFRTIAHCHVNSANTLDITLRKVPCEVGTNGKTFADSQENDRMYGKYKTMIYGVFTEEEKKAIVHMAINSPKKALETIANMVYVWNNKNDFSVFMDMVGRSSSWKLCATGKWQIVYNPSKHGSFVKKIENSNVPTLAEYLNK